MIDDIVKTLKHANSCHEAWWFLFGENSNHAQILNFRKNYFSLFETIRPALFTTFVIKLSSIFDKDSNSISLKTLVKKIEKSTNTIFQANTIDFDDLWKRGRKLYKYRNKVIAHRDKDVLTKNFAKETGFKYEDLKALLDDASMFLDEVLLFIGRRRFSKLSAASDFERLINKLASIAQKRDGVDRK